MLCTRTAYADDNDLPGIFDPLDDVEDQKPKMEHHVLPSCFDFDFVQKEGAVYTIEWENQLS